MNHCRLGGPANVNSAAGWFTQRGETVQMRECTRKSRQAILSPAAPVMLIMQNLERIQRNLTEFITRFEKSVLWWKSKELGLFSLEKHRLNRDLITVFKFGEIGDTGGEWFPGELPFDRHSQIWLFSGFSLRLKGYYVCDDEQLFFLRCRGTSKKELKSPQERCRENCVFNHPWKPVEIPSVKTFFLL